MNEKELLSGLLSAAYQMDEAGVASLYNEDGTIKSDALDILKAKDIERVKSLKPDTKKFFDDGYKKAESEIKSKIEKEFVEKTGFKSDKKGIELFLDYAAEQAKATGQITDDAIKRSPLYISTVDKLQKEKNEAIAAEAEKLTKFQSELSKKETFASASQKALEILEGMKPIISQDPAKAQRQKKLLLDQIMKDYEIERQGDNFIPLTKEGKVLEDNHGNRIQFEKIVKEIASSIYDFHQADPRSSAGNGKPAVDANGKPLTIPVPKNQVEYNKIVADSSLPVESRQAVKAAWAAQNAPAATV